MAEREELIKLNNQMAEMSYKMDTIYNTLVDTDLSGAGVMTRLSNVEKKLVKLEKYLWMLVGILSCGTIPLGTKVIPLIKEYIK